MEKLLDIKEVSERLSIRENTLRAWIFQKRLPVVRLGRLVRIRESALADWIKSQLAEPPDARLNFQIDLGELIGMETFTIFAGSFSRPSAVLTVNPYGETRSWAGHESVPIRSANQDPRLTVAFSGNVWSMSLDIPDEWLDHDRTSLRIGCLRTHFGSSAVDAYPFACVPWRINPGRVLFDLTAWSPTPTK